MDKVKRKVRRQVKIDCSGPTLVEQSHKESCDINYLMSKAQNTGIMRQKRSVAFYGDFVSAADFQTAQNKVIEAEKAFMELPSMLRKRFDNDPAQLIEFLQDGENFKEAIELGILVPQESGETTEIEEIVESVGEK